MVQAKAKRDRQMDRQSYLYVALGFLGATKWTIFMEHRGGIDKRGINEHNDDHKSVLL